MARMVLPAPGPASRTQSISAGFFDGSTRVSRDLNGSFDWCGVVSVSTSPSYVNLLRLTCSSATALPSILPDTITQVPTNFFFSFSPFSSPEKATDATPTTTSRTISARIGHLLQWLACPGLRVCRPPAQGYGG